MNQIYTTTVYVGDTSPYVAITGRNIAATLDDGSLVVTHDNQNPMVVRPGQFFASSEEAAFAAIEQLTRAKAAACRQFDEKIASVKKTYLQAQPASV